MSDPQHGDRPDGDRRVQSCDVCKVSASKARRRRHGSRLPESAEWRGGQFANLDDVPDLSAKDGPR